MPYIHLMNTTKAICEQFHSDCIQDIIKITGAKQENIHIIYHESTIINEEKTLYITIEMLKRDLLQKQSLYDFFKNYFTNLAYDKVSLSIVDLHNESYFG